MSKTKLKTLLGTALLLAFAYANANAAQPDAKDQSIAPQAPQSQPTKPLISRWKSEATFEAKTQDRDYQDRNYKWTGLLYGEIRENGYLVFKAGNNCIMSGYAELMASKTLWTFNGEISGCDVWHFNRHVFGSLRRVGNMLSMDVKNAPFEVGAEPVSYSISATMTPY